MIELDYEEYIENGFVEMSETEYNSNRRKSKIVIDSLTKGYFNRDIILHPIVKEGYKMAMFSQIEYFLLNGDVIDGRQKKSVKVGSTSVTYNDGGVSRGRVSKEAYMYLQGTGSLYRGVCYI